MTLSIKQGPPSEGSLDQDQYVTATLATVAFLREHSPQSDLLPSNTNAGAGARLLVSSAGVVPLLDMLGGAKSRKYGL